MHTVSPPSARVALSSEASAAIGEAVMELGLRFEGMDGNALLFKRGRFDPATNVPYEELRTYVEQALVAASVVQEVRDLLMQISNGGTEILIS